VWDHPSDLNSVKWSKGRLRRPGPIGTDMILDLGTDAVKGMINDSPMKRPGRPEAVAHPGGMLCSEASHFNTGAVFDMSGGRARY
jgi:2-dehydro-3-deoxy-L-rhamnonate dehydrogenase (NAD+)